MLAVICFTSVLMSTFVGTRGEEPERITQSNLGTNLNTTCTKSRDLVIDAYTGWPVGIECGDFPSSWYFGSATSFSCMIFDSNTAKVVFKVSSSAKNWTQDSVYRLENVTKPINLVVVIKPDDSDPCVTKNVAIKLSQQPLNACDNLTHIQTVHYNERSSTSLQCRVPYWLELFKEDVQFSWAKNCGNTSLTDSKELKMDLATANDAGVYTCHIGYKGRSLIGTSYRLVYETSKSTASVVCPGNVTTFDVNSQAIVTCFLNFSTEKTISNGIKLSWTKISEGDFRSKKSECVVENGNETSQENISCKLTQGNGSSVLINQNTNTSEFTLNFHFKSPVPSDAAGKYVVTANLNDSEICNSTFSLTPRKIPTVPKLETASCTKLQRRVVSAYMGWPLTISCNSLAVEFSDDSSYYDDDYYSDPVNGECQVWSQTTRKLLFSKGGSVHDLQVTRYATSDISNNTELKYILLGKSSGKCWFQEVELKIVDFPATTCQQSLKNHLVSKRKKAFLGKSLKLSCGGVSFFDGKYSETFKVTWFRNCTQLNESPSNSGSFQLGRQDGSRFRIPAFSYQHPGIYTCALEHNGQIYYVNHVPVCVRSPQTNSKVFIKCKKRVVQAELGSNVAIECVGNFGTGTINGKHVSVRWHKMESDVKSTSVCVNQFLGKSHRARTSSNILCDTSLTQAPCFLHVSQQEEREFANSKVKMRILFKNVTKDDLGKYLVVLSTHQRTKYYPNATVDLVQSHALKANVLNTKSSVIIACIVVVVGVVFVALGVFAFRRFKLAKIGQSCKGRRQFDHMELGSQISSSPQRSP